MKRLLSIALLAATLSAQSFDGNGALEGFYTPHRQHWYASKKFWVPVVIFVAAGVTTGVLASKTGHTTTVPPITPTPIGIPSFTGPTFIGIGGPGVPAVIVGGHK